MTSHIRDNADPLWNERRALAARIGALWRGDWPGHVFDGRDGQGWLDTVMNGDADDLAGLADDLAAIERSYTDG